MQIWKIRGTVKAGIGWVTAKWNQIVVAHRSDIPDIDEYRRGTLNVVLTEPWAPPDDENHRRRSHQRGLALDCNPAFGADFLANGNYIHPTVQVCSINGVKIGGRLYFPGIDRAQWEDNDSVWATISPIYRLEILSRDHLRDVLGIGLEDEAAVEVELENCVGCVESLDDDHLSK